MRKHARLLVIAAVAIGAIGWTWMSSARSEDERAEVRDELVALYDSPDATAPTPLDVGAFLFDPTEDSEPEFPLPEGVLVYEYGVDGQDVWIEVRGSDRANGWCFRVVCGNGEAAISSRRC